MVVEFVERGCEKIPSDDVAKIATKICDDSTTLETIKEMYRIRGVGGLTNTQIEQIMIYWSDCDECAMRADLYNDMLVITYDLRLGDRRVHIYRLR